VGVVEELIDRLVAAERDRLCYSRSAWQRYMAGVWKTLEPDEGDHLPYNMVREVSKKPGGPKYSWHLVKEVQNGARVELAKPVGIWDQDPHKLAFTNITLNLKTFEPEPHSPAHYITAGVPYDYDPNATGPNWDRYMTYLREHPEVGPEVVDFLIEYLGYCLTADTSAEIMLFLVGKRGSGKSTFIEGAEAMLGRDLVMAQSVAGLQERFGRAGIVGKRMILSKELSALKLLETDIISNIVSGERIRIEHKGLDGYDYTPVAKIIQAANNLPRVPNTEAGIYRRLQVVRFPNLEVTPDTAIKEGIKAEGPHILNTALRGLKRLRDNDGFTIPARVRAASAAWHDDNNIVQMFFDECVEEGNKMIRVARLHTLYKRWCEQHNYKPVALNLFGQQARSVPFYQVHHTNPKNVSKLRDIDLTEEGHAVNESSYKEAINWADI
jgi:putative DNA primase/helicase